MFITNEHSGCQVRKPTWNGTRTVFRPFPMVNPDDPTQWDAFRLSDEPRDTGDWIRRYDMVTIGTTAATTFIIKDPRDRDSDTKQSPPVVLWHAIKSAVKGGQALDPLWAPLLEGGANKPAALKPPSDGFVMQGLVFEQKSVVLPTPVGMADDHPTVVFLMSQSAGEALLTLIDQRDPNTGAFTYGDITDFNAGAFITFCMAGAQQANTGAPKKIGEGGPASIADRNRYDVTISDTYNGYSASLSHCADAMVRKIKPWDSVIRIPTYEEQVRLLCNSGIPASALVYALGDQWGEFIPEHIWEQARLNKGFAVGQAGGIGMQPAGAPGMMPAPAPGMMPAPPVAAPPVAPQPMGVAPAPVQTGTVVHMAPPTTQTAAMPAPVPPQQHVVPPIPATIPAGPPATGFAPRPMQQTLAPLPGTQTQPPQGLTRGVAADPSMPQVNALPPVPQAAPPTVAPVPEQAPAAGTPVAAGFAPQPTHASPERSARAAAALELARQRTRQAS